MQILNAVFHFMQLFHVYRQPKTPKTHYFAKILYIDLLEKQVIGDLGVLALKILVF